ncbi:hypothetical protein J3E69DRAFT_109186 [Trichoderma sp. SZMC 28015]
MQPFDNCLPVLGLNTTPYPFPYSLQLLSNQVLVQSPSYKSLFKYSNSYNFHSKQFQNLSNQNSDQPCISPI